MRKKGELTSSQIGKIILTIAGFVIMLVFLLIILDLQGTATRETCRLSVLARATAPDIAQRLAPLKCTTEKLCLSSGDKCTPEFLGEKDVKKIKLPSGVLPNGKPLATQKIEEETANAMFDCWKMMGEGKLNLFGGGKDDDFVSRLLPGMLKARTTCVICSRLAVSPDTPGSTLNRVDVNEYMDTHQVPGSSYTYINHFTDLQVTYPKEFVDNFTNTKKGEPTREISIIFMQILTEDKPFDAALDTGAYTGAFIIGGTSGLGPFGRILSFKATGILAAAVSLTTGGIAYFQTWQNRQVSAAYCGKLTGANSETAAEGCSIVTGINYKDISKINNLCSVIEGNP